MKKKITSQQIKALHLFYTMLADALNDAGLDQRRVLKPSVDIPWTQTAVKEQLWRPIQLAMLSKKSTTDLNLDEIDPVYNTLTRHLSEKFGVALEFPSIQSIMNQLRMKELDKKRRNFDTTREDS